MLGFNALGTEALGDDGTFVPNTAPLRKSAYDPWADNNVSGASDLWDSGLAGSLLTRDYFDQAPAVTVTGMAHFQITSTGAGTSYTSPELQFGAGLNLLYLRFNNPFQHINSLTVNGVAATRLVPEPTFGDTSEIWAVVLPKAIRSTFVTNHNGNALGDVIVANVKGVNVTPTYVSNSKLFNAYPSPMTSEVVTCPAGGVIIAMGAIQGGFNAATAPSAFVYGPIKATGDNSSYVATRTTTGTFELTGGGNGFASIAMIAFAPETTETPLVLTATLNPNDKHSIVLSNGNLTFAGETGARQAVRGTIGKSSGKWYFEGTANSSGGNLGFGVADKNARLTAYSSNTEQNTSSAYQTTGFVGSRNGDGNYGAYGAGDKIGCAIDATLGKIWYSKNGVFNGDPVAGTGGITIGGTGAYYPLGFADNATDIGTINFGATKFVYPAPAGFSRFQELTPVAITTFDPNRRHPNNAILTNNNLTINGVAQGAAQFAASTQPKTKGKWYFEVKITGYQAGTAISLINSAFDVTTFATPGALDSNGITLSPGSNVFFAANGLGAPTHPNAAGNSVATMQVCFDAATGDVWFGENNVFNGNPTYGIGGYASGLTEFFAAVGPFNAGDFSTINFGATAFDYAPPSGFSSWDILALSSGLSAPYGLATETDTAFALTAPISVGIAIETDTAFALARSTTRAIGLSTEAETSLALTATIARATGLSTETETSFALARSTTRTAGLASETETALALTATTARATGLASETETALALTATIARATGLASEADTSFALARSTNRATGLAVEADTAFAITVATAGSTGLATETDTAFALITATGVGIATEAETSFALARSTNRATGLAIATDSALALTATIARATGLVSEVDTAFAITATITRATGLASETETSFALARSTNRTTGLASEADTAAALAATAIRAIGLASEANSALARPVSATRVAGLATEADTSFALARSTNKSIGLASETGVAVALIAAAPAGTTGLATETDTAQAVGRSTNKPIGLATETETALARTPAYARVIGLATETDTAFALSSSVAFAIGLATETATAFALAPRATRAVSVTIEINTSFALVGATLRAVGLTTDTEQAFALAVSMARNTGLAVSTEVTFQLSGQQTAAALFAQETDTAFALLSSSAFYFTEPVKGRILFSQPVKRTVSSDQIVRAVDSEGVKRTLLSVTENRITDR